MMERFVGLCKVLYTRGQSVAAYSVVAMTLLGIVFTCRGDWHGAIAATLSALAFSQALLWCRLEELAKRPEAGPPAPTPPAAPEIYVTPKFRDHVRNDFLPPYRAPRAARVHPVVVLLLGAVVAGLLLAFLYARMGFWERLGVNWYLKSHFEKVVDETPPAAEPCPCHRFSPRFTLPEHAILRSRASRVDGLGLNVLTCLEVIARYQGIDGLKGLAEWAADKPGGSYPGKLKRQLEDFAHETHRTPVRFAEYEGSDEAFLQRAVDAGYPVAVSDHGGLNSRYGSGLLTMVVLVHFDNYYVCLFDPNFPGGGERYEWVPRSAFRKRWTGNIQGWAVLLEPYDWLHPGNDRAEPTYTPGVLRRVPADPPAPAKPPKTPAWPAPLLDSTPF